MDGHKSILKRANILTAHASDTEENNTINSTIVWNSCQIRQVCMDL